MGTNQETIESLTRLNLVLKAIAKMQLEHLPVTIANSIKPNVFEHKFIEDVKTMARHIREQKKQMNQKR
jgi:hypothetical protein